MNHSTLPKSTRKFIRTEKARIRAQFSDAQKQEELINALYNTLLNKPVAVVSEKAAPVEAPKAKAEEKTKAQKPKAKPAKVGAKK